MRSTKSKNQNEQFPSEQGRAARNEITFHATIHKFFKSNDEDVHITFLTERCRSFISAPYAHKTDSLDIANGVFSGNVIKQFISGIEQAYLSGDLGMSTDEASVVGEYLDPIGSTTAIEILDAAIITWIHPEDPDFTIEYLNSTMAVFCCITDLIRVCNKINNHRLFAMEGGLSC